MRTKVEKMGKRMALKPARTAVLMPAALCAVLMLGGCAGHGPFIPGPLLDRSAKGEAPLAETDALAAQRQTALYQTPKPPPALRSSVSRMPPPQPRPEDSGDLLDATVDLVNLPLPQFIDAVFVHALKRNVSVDPQVVNRTDMVSLRTGKPQTAEQIFVAARAVLRAYGVAVIEFPGLVRVVPDTAQSGYLPEIRRGRAQPEVPASTRPVFHFVELEHTTPANVTTWLRTLFKDRLTVQDDAPRNALLISGQTDTIGAAMEAIQLLDQPLMRGRLSARVAPVFVAADELAKRVGDMLVAEGYAVGTAPNSNAPILVLPIGALNSVIVFAGSEQLLNHALRWAQEIDQPAQGRGGSFITYQVRNTVAADLAKTLQELMAPAPGAAAPAAGTGAAAAAARGPRVVVNPAGNSLIIQATPADYQQWHGLLRELDRPARTALVMATVAEVRLSETEQFGFQWLAKQFASHGYNVDLGTVAPGANFAAPSAGAFRILLSGLAGDPRALLTALASSNKIRILSNPSIMARNGEAATIQVGQEVPILTSQVSNANTGATNGSAGILQTIQYRNTGVILKVKPVIHSGGRVDLEVAQEVSAAQANETGVNSSPIILTRKIETKLSVSDGDTVLLGGLMQEQKTGGNAGIPLLKDIPFVGALFRTSTSDNFDRTELVVLLTPYVIEDDYDARAVTEAFRNRFDWAAPAARKLAPSRGKSEAPQTGAGELRPAAQLPDAGPQTAMTIQKSQPYALPALPPAAIPSSTVAPKQQSAIEAPKTDTPPFANGPAVTVDSAGATDDAARPRDMAAPEKPDKTRVPQGKPVTDESLRQELLEAVRGSKSGAPMR